jgi:hypothetical protein
MPYSNMELETKPNRLHHEQGQKEPLGPAKITPTNVHPEAALKVKDY